ncbi:MAG: hydroxylamine reductase [Clostridia bacterium]|nr:hydroxylamine reductase [Clostridia bacterium]
MFCFQCQQTAKGVACTGSVGVCGKTSEVANLQDELTGALIGLARACEHNQKTEEADRIIYSGLFAAVTNVNFDADFIRNLIRDAHDEKERIIRDGDGKEYPDYDMRRIWDAEEDIRSGKSLILLGMRGMAAYAHNAAAFGYRSDKVYDFFYKGLRALGEEMTLAELIPLITETGEANYACMELLDKANTDTFGEPVPTEVSMLVEPGPFIVISGHDFHDLQQLLEQTEGKGINVYTHCEMLPAHGYPGLKKYRHLKGNFGTAWENQQKEFADLPAPILFTTNCLMPPKPSYADRVFTTEVVSYPETVHIGADKDFTPVIEKALELGGYKEPVQGHGINGGTTLTTGFAHHAVLEAAPQIVQAVKDGALRHFFLVAGCDGAFPSRKYYTEFVEATPSDTAVLTLACGKYRFNDLDLGKIGDLPRLMDVGQCNDAYSAIRIALALAEAFDCGVNELPLSFVISWYEQKAVCVLLTLLYLGIQNIRLGPSLPAFVSPDVLTFLSENFKLAPSTTPEADLKALLGEG